VHETVIGSSFDLKDTTINQSVNHAGKDTAADRRLMRMYDAAADWSIMYQRVQDKLYILLCSEAD